MVALVLLWCAVAHAATGPHGQVKEAVLNYSALRAGQQEIAAVVVEIKPGFHAQSHTPVDQFAVKFEMTLKENPALVLGEPIYPEGKIENYPLLGRLSVYTGRVLLRFPVQAKADGKPGKIQITGSIQYQACDDSVCYPPEELPFKIETEIVGADATVTPNAPELFPSSATLVPATAPSASVAAQPPASASAANSIWGGYAGALVIAFLVGIVFNVMPCVLPVLPLKAIGFYEVSQHNRAKSVALGAVFSLGLIATFATFGLLIFVFHAFDWGDLFKLPWFTAFIVIVLTVMAISTFGLITVEVPTSLYNISPRHDTYLGNFQFGILTALLSTPCTFGMFVSLLAWAILQPPIVGVLMLVTVGAGMASPYFILSAFPEVARRFPRTGPWAEVVKQLMGFLLLLAAVYFARPFLHSLFNDQVSWWAPFAVVVAAAVFLVVRAFQLSQSLMPRLVATALALVMVLGALKVVLDLTSRPYQWTPYSNAALASAQSAGKIVLIDFTADWCTNCQYLEAHVLHSKQVAADVRQHDVLMLRADVTRRDAPGQKLLDKFNLAGSIPLTVIYSPNLAEPIQLTGIYSREDLKTALDRASVPAKAAVATR
jgi:thiol:disulfide interchange protein DsbD